MTIPAAEAVKRVLDYDSFGDLNDDEASKIVCAMAPRYTKLMDSLMKQVEGHVKECECHSCQLLLECREFEV